MIFCVEDDAGIRDVMTYALNSAGLASRGLGDGEALFAALKEERPELILLDIMLPGEDGISILKRLRQNAATALIPVIMATAKGTEYDKVLGLDLGADDYLAKPFGMMELVSRTRAVLRRAGGDAHILRRDGVTLDPEEHTVTAQGKRVELTLKEYELLKLFMERPGMAFTRDRLLQSVWGVDFPGETRTVDVHINTLRAKLGPSGGRIVTVRGVGYRWETAP